MHHIAEALIDAGHYVLVVSPEDGVYRKRFTDIGADVIVDPLALSGHPSVIDLAKNFDAVICNTIVCWPVPAQLAAYTPVYLYVHESELIRHYVDNVPGFREGLASAAAIWAAGSLAVSKIKEYCDLDAVAIETGVEELPNPPGDEDYPGSTVIAMAGTYEPRKGQDLAIDGFQLLPSELQMDARLVMAGRTTDFGFRHAIERRAKNNPRIVFRDELDYAQVVDHLRRADIVLVASRDDTGPTTAMDALCAGKILIASATSGISRYLVDGESGFILRNNGPEDISATLCRALAQKSRWPQIRQGKRIIRVALYTGPIQGAIVSRARLSVGFVP